MTENLVNAMSEEKSKRIQTEINGMSFTKNFRSASAEEWYIFLPSYTDPRTGGAAGKAIVHYNLYGNKEIHINTTIIYDALELHNPDLHQLVYAISEETVNRLVGYADTLLSVHAGENSYDAVYNNS
ncbi:hypothetical protein IMZ08_20370 [Bacillus luteolus]|uniref:Uncharacterized protein n=1 Tax=Litchfieldia luteola TaxID=682179 RepID=A0ABR9QPG4_9BACI|nr:hypothetical protein [Cytobacillus luteolus]MBE4910400.1 hypothetical protein [Cytobacillus luteolus]MBP1942024.1 hypothetical protein [Cytobacillus luteolus]